MRISDWSSDVCSSDLSADGLLEEHQPIDEVRHELLLVRGPLFSISVQAGPAVPGCRFRSMRCRHDIPDELVRSEEHTSELQSLMRISYAVFCLKKKKKQHQNQLVHQSLDTLTN